MTPTWSNMNDTAPVSARLPPLLVKVERTSDGGAVAIVGQHLDDDGDAAGPVALVADLVIDLGVAAQRLLDGALDIVLGHVLGPRRDDGGAQPRIHGGIGQPQLGRDGDFAGELAEQLGPHRVLPPLAVHDVLEL